MLVPRFVMRPVAASTTATTPAAVEPAAGC